VALCIWAGAGGFLEHFVGELTIEGLDMHALPLDLVAHLGCEPPDSAGYVMCVFFYKLNRVMIIATDP
jgi:hypothetical protein